MNTGRGLIPSAASDFVEVGNLAFSSSVMVLRPELEEVLGRDADDAEEEGFPEEDDGVVLDVEDAEDGLTAAGAAGMAAVAEASGCSIVVYSSIKNNRNPSKVRKPTV